MDKNQIILKLISNPLRENKYNGEYITIAELKTLEINNELETTDVNTAIVSNNLIKKIKASHLNPVVKQAGVNYDENYVYKPSFGLNLSKSSGLKKTEPLVVSWCSGNHTTLIIDQGFLSTFQLAPRILKEEILWDDLKKPTYAIVKNKLLSEYNFPIHSEAYVKVKKDYLAEYLYLRKKTAVQIFTIKRDITITADIAFLLKEKKYFIEEYGKFEIRIRKYDHKENKAHLEINGYKILFQETCNHELAEERSIGHYWKGIDDLVTQWRISEELSFAYVHVSDEVLVKYESDEDYEVYPEFGSVRYRNQWSVSHCERVGRNAIRIDLKKLYEGNRYDVIDYWNQFSIHPSEIIPGEHIAFKGKRLIKKYFLFGRLLANLSNHLLSSEYSASDIIDLNEEQIEYTGWSEFHDYKQITTHVNLTSFSKEQFISRCKKLYILLAENLKEKSLRRIVEQLGFSSTETKEYRSLKLLELILKYFYISFNTGLDPITHKEIIIERTTELKEFKTLRQLFALNNLRQLDAHKGGDSKLKLEIALTNLDIEPKSISNNYADACFQLYDSLDEMFIDINKILSYSYNA